METNGITLTPDDERLVTLAGLFLESVTGIREHLDAALAKAGTLSDTLFEPLLRLSRSDGGMLRMSDLSAQCRYTPSAITRTADKLTELGFAERMSCPNDRRVVHLAITDAGRAAVAASLPGQIDVLTGTIFASLDDAELTELERLVRKVRDAVHPCAAAAGAAPADPECDSTEED